MIYLGEVVEEKDIIMVEEVEVKEENVVSLGEEQQHDINLQHMGEVVEVKEEDVVSLEEKHQLDTSLQQQQQSMQQQRTTLKNYHNLSVISLPRVTKLAFFEPPYQRQCWGDTQILPHINWGDLFFDLFYVAAAYNLSYVLLYSPNAEGFLYLLGLFGPILLEWFQRTFFDARFAYGK